MIKRIVISILVFSVCSVMYIACGTADKTSNSNSNTATDNGNKSATPATTTSPATAATTTSGDKVGIPECDEYLTKYEACVSGKVPEALRAQYTSSLEQTRKSWREMAANPQTKPSLVKTCEMANDTAKKTFGMFGCDF